MDAPSTRSSSTRPRRAACRRSAQQRDHDHVSVRHRAEWAHERQQTVDPQRLVPPTSIGDCSENQNTTSHRHLLNSSTTKPSPPGVQFTIQLGGVTNPTAPGSPDPHRPDHLGPRHRSTGTFTDAATNQISQPVVTPAQQPRARARARSRIRSRSRHRRLGACPTLANSVITITFPSGTGLRPPNVSSSSILTPAANHSIGDCSENQRTPSPQPASILQQRDRRRRRTTHHPARRRHQPSDHGDPRRLTVQTTSDPTSVNSGPYNIGVSNGDQRHGR